MLEIAEKVLAGDKRAISRAISLVEDDAPEARCIIRELHAYTGSAYIIGVTGPPGVGKSTLVDSLANQYRKACKTVGIVAVDPSSPFSGGALLGDRIRMQRHALDPGVFVRSLASRGRVGGISAATSQVVKILDAAGKDVVIVETVGAGQSEVDIMQHAHSVVVVMAPGLGDDIQAIKAGILEIADVFAVNKADLDGAKKTLRDLEMALEMRSAKGWKPPVVLTVARSDQGTDELVRKLDEHVRFMQSGSGWQDKLEKRAMAEVRDLVAQTLVREVIGAEQQRLMCLSAMVALREIDPYQAASEIIEQYHRKVKEQPTEPER